MFLDALIVEYFRPGEFDMLTLRELEALYADINDLICAEGLSAREAIRTLQRRIRPATLQAYVSTLTAGRTSSGYRSDARNDPSDTE